MSGSGESHKCYFYKKNRVEVKVADVKKTKTATKTSSRAKKNIKNENVDPNPTSTATEVDSEDEIEFISELLGVELDTSILVDVKDPNRTNAGTKRDKKSKESEDKSIIQCDPLFSTIIQLSLNKRDLTDYCQQFVKDYFAEGRPQRSCSKSPQRYSDGATGANSSKTSDAGSVTPPRTPNRNNTIINSMTI